MVVKLHFQSYGFLASSPIGFVLYIVYDRIRVDPSVHLAVDVQVQYIQRLKCSIAFERFKFFNIGEHAINMISTYPMPSPFMLHLNVKELYISGSIHIILFTEVVYSSRNEIG